MYPPQKSLIKYISCLFLFGLVACHSNKKISKSSESNNESHEKEKTETLRSKYATLLGIESSEIKNTALYSFIENWIGAPYKYGGKSKDGIDCSGFTEILYKTVFKKIILGSSKDLYTLCDDIPKNNLKEGDLVFFKIESKKISHVGIYLANNKFVHATVKKGVMINDLNETYYLKYFYKGGRLK